MRILVLAPQRCFQQRGTPIAVRALVETLAGLGHQLDLLVFHEGESIEVPGVTLYRTRVLPGVRNISPGFSIRKMISDVAMLLQAIRLVRRDSYDLVHAVEEGAFLARFLQRMTGIPYVYDMDSSLSEELGVQLRLPSAVIRVLESLENRAVRHSLGVIAVSAALEERVLEIAPDKPVLRLEDFSHLQPVESGPDLRRELGIDGAILLYVSNFLAYQRIAPRLEPFARVLPRRPDAHLVLIGGSAKRTRRYVRKSRALAIDHHTHFPGPRPFSDLKWYLQQADLLVSPRTRGRNTPLKIYSYLDSGRPVLATRELAHTQVLDESISMLAEATPESMSDAAIRLLEDSELRENLARRARKRVSRRYSRRVFERKLGAFYDRIETMVAGDRREPAARKSSPCR